MKVWKLLILAGCAISLAGCGYPSPSFVEIFVDTSPPDASCAISRGGQPVGHIDATPGIALVPNEEADYLVSCRRNAYADVSALVHTRAHTRYFVEYFGGKAVHPTGGASITFALTPGWPTTVSALSRR